jgi:hypothetical protein
MAVAHKIATGTNGTQGPKGWAAKPVVEIAEEAIKAA